MANNGNSHAPLNHKISQEGIDAFNHHYNLFENACRENAIKPTKALFLECLVRTFSEKVKVKDFLALFPDTQK